MNPTYTWYETLIRPEWAPPAWLFGPVWSVLYLIIFVTFAVVFYKSFKKEISPAIALPFILNLVFNFLFSPIQFGLQNNLLALIDVVLVVLTLVWGLVVLWKASKKLRWIVYLNLPYLLWTIFATTLQATITFLNF
jgi:translocator protein